MSAADTTYLPIPVSDVDMAFGGKAMEILPPMDALARTACGIPARREEREE